MPNNTTKRSNIADVSSLPDQRRQLEEEIQAAKERRDYWKKLIGESPFSELLEEWARDTENCRNALEEAKTSEVPKLQGTIKARKAMAQAMRERASDADVNSAEFRLRQFLNDNALFFAENPDNKQKAAAGEGSSES